jgi:hypothetical protein
MKRLFSYIKKKVRPSRSEQLVLKAEQLLNELLIGGYSNIEIAYVVSVVKATALLILYDRDEGLSKDRKDLEHAIKMLIE